jgi:hypothetical protein
MPVDNVLQFRARPADSSAVNDDELIQVAEEKITQWQAAGTPSLTEIQTLFFESLCAGASPMARDKIISTIIVAFGDELGGKRALLSTWTKLAKDVAAQAAQEARENVIGPELAAEEKAALRDLLWPSVCELGRAPDLMDRVVKQVQVLGVVNEP